MRISFFLVTVSEKKEVMTSRIISGLLLYSTIEAVIFDHALFIEFILVELIAPYNSSDIVQTLFPQRNDA